MKRYNDFRSQRKARIDSIIGQNIRNEREMRKMTRDELAEIMELTVSHMGLIERGERGATAVTLEKLARTFCVPVDNFFDESEMDSAVLREDGYDSKGVLMPLRQKISTLVSRLEEHELEFIIHVIKGVLALNHTHKDDPNEFKEKNEI